MGSSIARNATKARRIPTRSQLFDLGLVVALLAGGLVESSIPPTGSLGTFPRSPDAWGVLATVLILVPLAMRRRHPVEVMAASGTIYLAAVLIGYANSSAMDSAQLIAVYSVGVYAFRPAADRARWIAAFAIAGGLFWCYRLGRFSLTEIALMYATWLGAAIFGEMVSIRRRYQEALEERARRLEAERDERARSAVQEERARIARDLHDVWAHTLSLVVVQAGAAQEVLDGSPAQARQALEQIQQAGREALAEMRRLVRSDPGAPGFDRGPAPQLRDLAGMVDEVERAGLPVELTVAGAIDDLPEDIGLSAYRIVQQALTNTLTHGGPEATAHVAVRRTDGELRIDVVDDGLGATAAADPARQGRGLIGMRERVALFGGELQAGPRAEGGFEVRARIPTPTRP